MSWNDGSDALFFDAVGDDVMHPDAPQINDNDQNHPSTTDGKSGSETGNVNDKVDIELPMAVTQNSPEPSPQRSSRHVQLLQQQQPEQQEISSTQNDEEHELTVEFSKTEGTGQWAAWQRNFESPLKALLDLFDNAVDACFVTQLQQELAFASDPSMSSAASAKPTIDISLDPYGGDSYGLVMRNTCREAVPPIKQVLNVNTRSKQHKTDQIGENGVGAKQACANLSDLSFVLIKSPEKYSLGILMEELQKDGVCIPSIEFKNPNHEGASENTPMLEEQLYLAIQRNPKEIAKAVESYGQGDIQAGMDQLLRHFEDMTKGKTWKKSDYVFTVILAQLRHGAGSRDDEERSGENEDLGDNNKARSLSVMKEMTSEVPILYIHIPDTMRVVINKQRLKFQYWERRLTELTQFSICIDTKNSWETDEFWKSDGQQLFNEANETQDRSKHRTYLRVFCGFDSYRALDKFRASPMSMMVYSREAGRRLVYERDARSLLGVTHGGSDFCQGVTILLDDYQSTLPLNPTKQGLAFGKEEHGQVHKENLYAMLGAVAHCYWHYHFDKHQKSKRTLTESVTASHALIEQNNERLLQQEQDVVDDEETPELPVSHGGVVGSSRRWHAMDGLGEGTFRRFEGIEWRKTRGAYRSTIRCGEANRRKISIVQGRSSVVNLEVPQVQAVSTNSASKKRRSVDSGVLPETLDPLARGRAASRAAMELVQNAALRAGDNYFDLEDEDDSATPSNHTYARKRPRSSLESYGATISRRPGREESKEDYESAVLTSQRNKNERQKLLEERQNDKRIIQQLMEQRKRDEEKIMEKEAKLQEATVKLMHMGTSGTADGSVDGQAYARMEQQVLKWRDIAKAKEEELRIEREKNYELSMRNDELLNDSRMQLNKRRELERELDDERNRSGSGSAPASNGAGSSQAVGQLERRVDSLKKDCQRHISNVKMYKSLSEKRGQEIDELNKVMSRRAEEQKILEARLKLYEDSNNGDEYI